MNTTTTSATPRSTTRMSNPFARGAMLGEKRIEPWKGASLTDAIALAPPLRWRKPRHVILTADLFHESVPDEWIDRVFAVMALAPRHTFQVLTKRPERMREMLMAVKRPGLPERVIGVLSRRMMAGEISMADYENACHQPIICPPNVWLGTSVEDQASADERVPELLATPAALRFVSAEPLLGPLDLRAIRLPAGPGPYRGRVLDALAGETWEQGGRERELAWTPRRHARLNWIVAGSESGPGARACDLDWVRSLRDQCAAANVAFFWKQHVENGRKIPLPALDGRTHDAMPEPRD